MKVIREIPREELSSEVLEFCGKNTAYEVEEKIIPLKKGEIALLWTSADVACVLLFNIWSQNLFYFSSFSSIYNAKKNYHDRRRYKTLFFKN